MNNISKVPNPSCEPVKSYAPGTNERKVVQEEYKKLMNTIIDIPMFIDGKNIYYSYNLTLLYTISFSYRTKTHQNCF